MSNYELDFYGMKMDVEVDHGFPPTREDPGEPGCVEQVTLWIGDIGIILSEIPTHLSEWIDDEVYTIEKDKE